MREEATLSDAQTKPSLLFKGRVVVGSPQTCAHLMKMAAARQSDNPSSPSRDEMYAVWWAETSDGGRSLHAKYMELVDTPRGTQEIHLNDERAVCDLLNELLATQ